MHKAKSYPCFISTPYSICQQVLVRLSSNMCWIWLYVLTFSVTIWVYTIIQCQEYHNKCFYFFFLLKLQFGSLRLCYPPSSQNDLLRSLITLSSVLNEFMTSHCSQNKIKPLLMVCEALHKSSHYITVEPILLHSYSSSLVWFLTDLQNAMCCRSIGNIPSLLSV